MKKLLTSLLCVVMVVCFMPSMAFAATTDASTKGSIEEITNVAKVDGDTITVSGSSLEWYPEDKSIGRWQNGWWVGFNIVAPESVTAENISKVTYSNDGSDPTLSFAKNKDGQKPDPDGRYYMGCWLPVTQDYLEQFLAVEGAKLQWTYKFDWNGDKTVDQTFTATVDPEDITLNKDGGTYCKTENGRMTVKAGVAYRGSIEKITDVAVVSGDAITVSGATLEWNEKNTTIGRYQDGWWVGFKIVAPDYVTAKNIGEVTYSNDGSDNLAKNFGTNKDGQIADGRYYMGCWLPVTLESLKKANESGTDLQWTYKFDWTGDGTVDQTFTATVEPDDITLNINGVEHKEHAYGAWEVTKEATYSEEGSKIHKCPCGATETEAIPKLVYVPQTPTDNVTNSGTTGTDNATTTADINTTASNGTANAVVDKTTADKIVDKATSNQSAEVVVDAKTSAGTATNTTVTLPTNTVKEIADKTDAEVTVKTDAAEVTLDQKAVDAVATKAAGADVEIVVEKTKDETKEMEFELKVVSNGVEIGEFDGGNVKVTVKLNASLAALKDAALTCVHIDDKGIYTKVGGAKNNDGTYTFTTTHFSSYAIMAEEEADKVIAEQETEHNAYLKDGVEKTTLKIYSSKGNGWIKIRWKKSDGFKVDGYELYRGKTKSSMKKYDTTKKTSYKNAKYLKKGNRYYYKVRGYRMVGGEKVYTKWSKTIYRIAI